jgi:aerobic-type carbon monoxide dehydrogenase small subunit (CoxS/CutS family)
MSALTLTVNGASRRLDAPSEESLLTALRERLHLTGTKYGCGEGQCGACTVLLDGRPVRSCRTKASEAQGKKVVTIEGLASGERLHPVQAAFLEVEAFQCGFCTSGMIVGAVALLAAKPDPSQADVESGLTGHVCRCGTYPRIVEAVRRAAKATRKGATP